MDTNRAIVLVGVRRVPEALGFPLVFRLALISSPLAADVSAEHGVAAGGDIRDSTITISGWSPERVQRLMDKKDQAEAERRELGKELAVKDAALISFFHILEQEQVPPELLAAKLAEIAQRHKDALARIGTLEVSDPKVKALVDEAREVVAEGEDDRAEVLLAQAEELELAAIREAEAIARRVQEAIDERRLSAAGVRAQKGNVTLIRLRYREAAEHFARAAELVPEGRAETRLGYLDQHADALYEQGAEKGDNAALDESIRAYRSLLIARPRTQVPLDWARTQMNLGNALATLGGRTEDRETLQRAHDAIDAAWSVYHDAGYMHYDDYFRGRLLEIDALTAGAQTP